MKELLIILLSWASYLSGYPASELPEVQFKDHQFFVQYACGGRECKIVGWYADGGVVYIDTLYSDLSDGFAASLVVHEFVHYLQDPSDDPCSREREAYHVQNRYLAEALLRIDRIQPGPCALAVIY